MVTLQLPAPVSQAAVMDVPDAPLFAVRETPRAEPPKPRLLDRVREALRTRHESRRTEEAYVAWIRRDSGQPNSRWASPLLAQM